MNLEKRSVGIKVRMEEILILQDGCLLIDACHANRRSDAMSVRVTDTCFYLCDKNMNGARLCVLTCYLFIQQKRSK